MKCVLSTLLKTLLESRALVFYTKGETTTTITLTNATFLIGALPLPIFYRAASWFFLNHAIYHIAPALFSDSEQFFVCITAEPSIVSSNAQMFTCVVWFGTKKNI